MKFQQIKESLGEDADVMEQDHEVQMARADCFHAAKNAIELHRILKGISERQGLEGWVSEKITLAADYLRTVREYLEYEEGRSQTIDFDKTDYNTVLDSYLGESKIVEDEGKGLSQKEIERKINTPNLSAKARELLIKAFGQFPQAKNEIDAIVNYLEAVKNTGETNITRLDRENRQQDTSISRSVVRANSKMLSVLRRLHQEGKLTQIGYHPSTDLPVPSKMTQGDLELLRSHADKHLEGSEKLEFNQAAHILVASDPIANIELQDLGGVRGTNPQGRGSEESRRGGAGQNLMIARSQQRRQTP